MNRVIILLFLLSFQVNSELMPDACDIAIYIEKGEKRPKETYFSDWIYNSFCSYIIDFENGKESDTSKYISYYSAASNMKPGVKQRKKSSIAPTVPFRVMRK